MSRQCRICLDTENPESMISPCMCRGTSAYIHETCFEQYLDYFPDRVCRVCNYRVPGIVTSSVDTFVFTAMVVWMMILLLLSTVGDQYKVLYFFMLFGVMIFSTMTNVFRGVFGIAITAISFLFTFLNPMVAVEVVVFIGLFGIFGVMFLYIPPEVMLMFMTILLIGSYSIFILCFFALKQDTYLTAFMVPIILILWACVIRARPPLRLVR